MHTIILFDYEKEICRFEQKENINNKYADGKFEKNKALDYIISLQNNSSQIYARSSYEYKKKQELDHKQEYPVDSKGRTMRWLMLPETIPPGYKVDERRIKHLVVKHARVNSNDWLECWLYDYPGIGVMQIWRMENLEKPFRIMYIDNDDPMNYEHYASFEEAETRVLDLMFNGKYVHPEK